MVIFFFFLGCSPSVETDEKPYTEVENFTLVETFGVEKKWILKAEKAIINEKKQEINFNTATLKFHTRKGVILVETTEGKVFLKTRDVLVWGNVKIVFDDGTILETTKLRWDSKKKKLLGDEFVKITKRHQVMEGKGLELDPASKTVVIKEKVRVWSRS